MALEDVLEHAAVPAETRRKTGVGVRIHGEIDVEENTDDQEDAVGAFDCALFLPLGQEDKAAGSRPGRNVRRPTLLYAPEDRAGELVSLTAETRLLVTAPEVTGAEAVEWKVDGTPQPFGRPGDDLVGYQAALVKVDD